MSWASVTAPMAAEDEETVVDTIVDTVIEIPWVEIIGSLVRIAVIFVLAVLLVRFARRAARRWVRNTTTRGLAKFADDLRQVRVELRAVTLGNVFADSLTTIIVVVAGIAVLAEVGIQLAPLIAGAGIAGLALGFGAQSLVRDFFSGFFILLEDQYGVGDVVKVGDDVAGLVEDISLRVTRLRSLDGTVWFVPNGEIRHLGNMSKEWARALMDIEVAYAEDIGTVYEVINEVATHLREDPVLGPEILEDLEILGVERLGDSGVAVRVIIKTNPLQQWAVMRRFRKDVKDEFDRRGIEIPFPHRTVYLRDDGKAREPLTAKKPAKRATRRPSS